MDIRTDRRGQAIQVGSVFLFAVAIVLFSTYQATTVPNENTQIEYQHNQQVHSELVTIRNTIATAPDRDVSKGVQIDLGTTYPSRTIGINPRNPAGRLRTIGTTDSDITVQISNAETVQGTPSFWDGTTDFNTGALLYEPKYNEYQAEQTVYDNQALYSGDTQTATLAEPSIINEKNIDLVMLTGSLLKSSSGPVVFDIKTVDRSQESIDVTNAGTNPLEIQFHSRQPASYWERVEAGDKGQYVEAVSSTDEGDGWHEVTIELTEDVTYDVTLTKVGIGEQVDDRKADGTKVSMAAADSLFRTQFDAWNRNPRPSQSCNPNFMGSHPTPVGQAPFIGGACNDAFAENGAGQNLGTERSYRLPEGRYEVGVTYWTLQSWDSENGKAYWRADGNTIEETWNYPTNNNGVSHKETFIVDHPGGEATLEFTSTLDQPSYDETFGINNVWVRHIDN